MGREVWTIIPQSVNTFPCHADWEDEKGPNVAEAATADKAL